MRSARHARDAMRVLWRKSAVLLDTLLRSITSFARAYALQQRALHMRCFMMLSATIVTRHATLAIIADAA